MTSPIYSPMQVAAASFIGTPMAAACLVRANVSERTGVPQAWLCFAAFCVLFVSFAAVNPFESRAVNVGIFLFLTCSLLAVNHLVSRAYAPPFKSWGRALAISVAFFLVWMTLLFVVFG